MTSKMKSIAFSILGGIALFAVLLGAVIWCFGSLGAAICWLNGESFYVFPKTIHLENREPGTEEIVTFRLQNLSNNDISVVGEKSSCSCAFSENIPITAKAKEMVELKVRVKLPKYKSDYDQTILFMVTTPEKLEMSPVRISASIPNPLPIPDKTETIADTEAKEENVTTTEPSLPASVQTDAKEAVQ